MKGFLYDILYYIFKGILKAFYTIFFRYEKRGTENIPSSGGVIIASNHLSYLDPPLIGISIKKRPLFIAKGSLFRNPAIGWFVKLYSLPVDRDNPKPSTMKEALKALRAGKAVIIFPEGTRSHDGSIREGKKGVGALAALSKAPVVPALIEGTDKALPVGAKFFKPAKVRVTFGRPIYYNKEEKNKEIQEKISEEVMDRIRELKEEAAWR